jgi:hypothetical protein
MKKQLYIPIALILLIVSLSRCTKTITDDSKNPFVQNGDTLQPVQPDLSKLEGLHANIFAVKCANPTCHDGSFEPDFRTVQSTYASLIYHPVTKNDANQSFTYRVVPGSAAQSWLYHRLTADEQLGRMPLYAEPLPANEIQAIKDWIDAGAKDIFNQSQQEPNKAPLVAGYALYDSSYTRVDSVRQNGWASPLLVKASQKELFLTSVEDDKDDVGAFQQKELRFSYTDIPFQPFKTQQLSRLWTTVLQTPFDASQFPLNTTIYMRVYVTDAQGVSTEFPNNNSPSYWIRNFSFQVLP